MSWNDHRYQNTSEITDLANWDIFLILKKLIDCKQTTITGEMSTDWQCTCIHSFLFPIRPGKNEEG